MNTETPSNLIPANPSPDSTPSIVKDVATSPVATATTKPASGWKPIPNVSKRVVKAAAESAAFSEHLQNWEDAAAKLPCTCGREYATPWLHGKDCPRWNAKIEGEVDKKNRGIGWWVLVIFIVLFGLLCLNEIIYHL